MFAGVFEDLDPLESPVNLFGEVVSMQNKNIYEVEVEAGSCIFIPSYYWWQTETKSESSIIYSYDFQTSSVLIDLLVNALDDHILD